MAGLYSSCADALRALAQGPGEFACHDYDTVREVVMCDAWHRLETPGADRPASFGEAIRDAWGALRQGCAPSGGITPEENTPVELAEQGHTPTVRGSYQLLDRFGDPAGRVVVESGGAITVCIQGDCHTDFVQPDPVRQDAVIAAMQDLYPTVGYHIVPEAGVAP